MREFVAAVRAIWETWQHGTRLSFEGEFYTPHADDADVHPRSRNRTGYRRSSSPRSAI